MAFLQRLIGYLANEVLVKGLAESQTFQRAAVAVHQASKVAKAQGNPPPSPPTPPHHPWPPVHPPALRTAPAPLCAVPAVGDPRRFARARGGGGGG